MRDDYAPSTFSGTRDGKDYRIQRIAVILAGLLLCAGVLAPSEKGPSLTTGSEALDRCRFQPNSEVQVYYEFTRSDLPELATSFHTRVLRNQQTLIYYQRLQMGTCLGAAVYFVFRDEETAVEMAQRIEESNPSNLDHLVRRFGQIVVLVYGYPNDFSRMAEIVFAGIEENFKNHTFEGT